MLSCQVEPQLTVEEEDDEEEVEDGMPSQMTLSTVGNDQWVKWVLVLAGVLVGDTVSPTRGIWQREQG
jgi:hypothetical protein